MTACSFCGSPIEAGTGKMYIRRDATVYHFCSSKCQRNQVELGRVNRHVRWTQAAEEHKSERVQAPGGAAKATAPKAKATKAPVKAKEPAAETKKEAPAKAK